MSASFASKMCGAVVPVRRDVTSLGEDDRTQYLDLIRRAADGDLNALFQVREMLPDADKNIDAIRRCRWAFDQINSKEAPKLKTKLLKLKKQISSIDVQIGQLQTERDQLKQEMSQLEQDHSTILNPTSLNQRLIILKQNPVVRIMFDREFRAIGI